MSIVERSTVNQPSASTLRPAVSPKVHTPERDPCALHFEQLTVPGLMSGPILPLWMRELLRRVARSR